MSQSRPMSIVYRNQAVAMFDEDAEVRDAEDKPERTRISARYDRTHWSAEYDRHMFTPDRGAGGPIRPLSSDPRYKIPRRERLRIARLHLRTDSPQPQKHYTEAEIAAVQEHGVYRLVKIAPHGERGGWRITAVCAGGHCDGKVRIFDPNTWLRTSSGALGCTSCEAKQRSIRLRARLESETHARHGVYELVEHQYNCAHHAILGRCAGPLCNGATRRFSYSKWQHEDEGRLGCKKCCRLTLVKTECPHGHAYDEANTVVDSQGDKRCKACALMRRDSRLIQMRAWWHRNKEGRVMNRSLSNRVRT
jgi:hypothetical protein